MEAVSLQALKFARVVELVDTLDLGSSALIGVGVRVPPLVLSFLTHPVLHIY